MDAATEHKQWEICANCGEQMVPHPRFPEQGGGGYPWLVCPKDLVYYATPLDVDNPDRPRQQCVPPKEMVPLDQLVHGAYYRGKCRNAHVARWNAERQKFIHWREKFKFVYLEELGYWQEGHRMDEFRPYGLMENPPFEIPLVDPFEDRRKSQ